MNKVFILVSRYWSLINRRMSWGNFSYTIAKLCNHLVDNKLKNGITDCNLMQNCFRTTPYGRNNKERNKSNIHGRSICSSYKRRLYLICVWWVHQCHVVCHLNQIIPFCIDSLKAGMKWADYIERAELYFCDQVNATFHS